MVEKYNPTRLLIEKNQGGLLIKLSVACALERHTDCTGEQATKSKEERSIEAKAMADEGRIYFAKALPTLASQCIEFAPKTASELHFDRADAYIQGVRYFIGRRERGRVMGVVSI